MRTQGFRTHVLLVLAGAVGLLSSLSRAWYARAPKPLSESADIGDVNGPLAGLFHGVQRWVADPGGVTARDALGPWATLLAALAAVAAVAALCTMVPALQGIARDPLRYGALAAAAIVAWRLVDPPRANEAWELRHGALIGAGAALVLLYGAMPLASAPRRARRAAPVYTPPPPPAPVYDTSSSVGPPGG